MKTCPRCLGAKNIKVFCVAGPDLRTAPCPDCRGRGVFRVRYPLIDPAIIPGKSVMRVDRGPPELFLTIDGAVESFGLRRRVVVLTRYAYEPHAKATARLVVVNRLLGENGAKRISGQRFADILVDVKKRLSAITGLPFRLENALDSVKQ